MGTKFKGGANEKRHWFDKAVNKIT